MRELLKLLIVDDEFHVRNILKTCVNWQELGIKIIGEASGTVEALELVETTQPDIIFTDICMPGMDGIEFSKKVIENFPAIMIVIITGHEEFEYAQKGISLGVSGFILKPINDEEITKIIQKIQKRIHDIKEHNEDFERIKLQLEENKPYLKEKFLNELISNELSKDEIKDKLSFYELDFHDSSFEVACIQVFDDHGFGKSGEGDKLILETQTMNLIEESISQYKRLIIFFDNKQRIVIINNSNDYSLTAICESLIYMAQKHMKISVSIGIGQKQNKISAISSSYKQAKRALEYRVIIGNNRVVSYNDVNLASGKSKPFDYDKAESLSFFIMASMGKQAIKCIDTFYEDISTDGSTTMNSARVIASNVVSIILNAILELGMNVEEVYRDGRDPYSQIFELDTIPMVKRHLKNLITKTIVEINGVYTGKVANLIKNIQEFLNKNLNDSSISLTSIATHFHVNSSYLSRIFKKETAMTFMEYLMHIRMERAIMLIEGTDRKAYMISELVGISEPSYFSKCFKRYTGLSMTEYRAKNVE